MFDWKNFIDLAQELIYKHSTEYSEALYRTVISRCYYGIFKQVEDYLKSFSLLDRDKVGRKLSSHKRQIYFLRNHSNPQVRKFGDKLDNLKRQRERADYKAHEIVNRFDAERAIKHAYELSDIWTKTIKETIS